MEADTVALSEGSVLQMCNGNQDLTPVLQVCDIRLVNTQSAKATERYRLLLSDGHFYIQGMLGTQRNDLIKSGRLQKGSIVVLNQFVCNLIQNRTRIVIICDLDMVRDSWPMIGDPQYLPPAKPSPGQMGDEPGNPQPSGNDPTARLNAPPGGYFQQPKLESGQCYESSAAPNMDPGHFRTSNAPPVNPKPEFGMANSGFGSPQGRFQNAPPVNPKQPEFGMGNSGCGSPPGRFQNAPPVNPKQPEFGMGNSGCGSPQGRFQNAPPVNPKPEFGVGNSGYGSPQGRFQNARMDVSHPPNTYARSQQPSFQQQQPPPMYINRGPVAKNEVPPRIIPIAALNPYQGRWTIKARVTSKGDLRHYSNPRGEGKVFNFDLLDSDGGEIRATCFNAVADQFFDLIEVGRVYLISKGTLKPAQKNFNHLANEFEITLDITSLVQPCAEDDSRIPKQQFNFRPISEIEGMENNSVVDVIGVVSAVSPPSTIMRKNGMEAQKRTVQLKDMSGRSVELTLWGNFCNEQGQKLQSMFESGNFPVLAVKAGRVSEFNGKGVGTLSNTQLFVEPDFPEAQSVREWFNSEGRSAPSVSISREATSMARNDVRKTLSQIKDEKLGTSEKPDWITVCATLSFMKTENFCYTACPISLGDRQCNKKVVSNGDGMYRCERCDQSVKECDYRYILQFQIQDYSGVTWVTAFQECGEEILDISAKNLFYLKYDDQDDEKVSEIIQGAVFRRYVFKLKVKEEVYSDEQRVKSTVVKAERADFAAESRHLLDLIGKIKGGDVGQFAPKLARATPGSFVGGQPSVTPSVYGQQQSGGFGGPNPNASGVYLTCSNCGATGHSSGNCPSFTNGPGRPYANQPFSGTSGGSSAGECFKCHRFGHLARDCPGLSAVLPAHGGGNVGPGRFGGIHKQHVGGF